jgi:hypothetical protein
MNPRFLVSVASLALVVSAAAGCGGSVDSRPHKWSYIAPTIIEPNCATANCHSALSQRGNVRLDTIDKSYRQALTWGGFLPLLRGEFPKVQRMPPDAPLPDPDIALIQAWFDDGKQWDGPGPQPTP